MMFDSLRTGITAISLSADTGPHGQWVLLVPASFLYYSVSTIHMQGIYIAELQAALYAS